MDFLPIFLNLRGRKVIVDGASANAVRRAKRALKAGANVHVFDPEPTPNLLALGNDISIHSRLPIADDLKGCSIVWASSGNEARDAQLSAMAKQASVLCNVAGPSEPADFITPSIVDRSPIVVAVSSGGAAPIFSRILHARIEATLPVAYGRLADFVGRFSDKIQNAIPDARVRRHFWERMVDGPAGDFFLAGNLDRATAQIDNDLAAEVQGHESKAGEVYLVGAGPGDPDLLTFRALRLMQRADVVLYDRLLGDDILSLVRHEAERIDVGKKAMNHTMAQESISDLLVRLAREGKRVLRLKGGDPYIFGRGGEEIETLAQAGIPFQVVPGITSASGCGTYAGIPLTHRDHAQSCTFITAHGKDGVLDLDWDRLARKGQTVAVYMGLGSIGLLTKGFLDRGMDPDMPVAVIENGTRPQQKTVTGTMATITDRVEEAALKGPAMIIVGSVVTLRDSLNWQALDRTAHMMPLTGP